MTNNFNFTDSERIRLEVLGFYWSGKDKCMKRLKEYKSFLNRLYKNADGTFDVGYENSADDKNPYDLRTVKTFDELIDVIKNYDKI